MSESTKTRLQRIDYTVAIICPLEVEMSAVRYMLDVEHLVLPPVDGDRNSYVFGRLGHHNVVVGFLPHGSQGIGAAATVAIHMKRSFPAIQLRLLVGLAGGVPSKVNDIRLGDVVVSTPDGYHGGVVQYDYGKETMSGFERKGYVEPPPTEWMDAVVLMKSVHRTRGNNLDAHITQMIRRYPQLEMYGRPRSSRDLLFAADSNHVPGQETCELCETSRIVHREQRQVPGSNIFFGLVASGDKVIKNAVLRDKLSQQAGGALCFEMEAAGLTHDFHCMVVRGICDYADSHKNDEWHAYGAAVAAACAKELLTYISPRTSEHRRAQDMQSLSENFQQSLVIARPPEPHNPIIAEYFMVPKQNVKDFLGRDQELDTIQQYFSSSVNDRPNIAVIHALGGQGKTQLVLEYCQRSRSKYRGIFWINSSSVSAAKSSFTGIADELNPSESAVEGREDLKVRFVLRTLSTWNDRWLMVFDNCDDPKTFSSMRELIPTTGIGDILLTSRHQGLQQLGRLIELGPLPVEAGIKILLGGYPNVDVRDYTEIGSKIVNRLGGLALAIKQAAAYIQHQELPIVSLSTFLTSFESQRQKIMSHIPGELWEYGSFHIGASGRDNAIHAFTTWEMSLEYLCPEDPNRQKSILHVLTLTALLAPGPVHEGLFRTFWQNCDEPPAWAGLFLTDETADSEDENYDDCYQSDTDTVVNSNGSFHLHWDNDKFWGFVRLVKSNSLAYTTNTSNQARQSEFLLHPLIRDWLQVRLPRRRRHVYVIEVARMISFWLRSKDFAEAGPDVRQTILRHMDAVFKYDTHHVRSGQHLGEMIEGREAAKTWAHAYFSAYQYLNSLTLYERIYRLCSAIEGPQHRNTRGAKKDWARCLEACGENDQAIQVLREIVRTEQRELPDSLQSSLLDKLTLCRMLVYRPGEKSTCEEARSILESIIQLSPEILPSKHNDRLYAMKLMTIIMERENRYHEAEDMHRLILKICATEIGEKDLSTRRATLDLVYHLRRRQKFDEADAVLRKLWLEEKKIEGEQDLRHEITLALCSSSRDEVSDGEAEQMLRDLLKDQDETPELVYTKCLGVKTSLAALLEAQERYGEALEIRVETLGTITQARGFRSDYAVEHLGYLIWLLGLEAPDAGQDEIVEKVMNIISQFEGIELPEARKLVRETATTMGFT